MISDFSFKKKFLSSGTVVGRFERSETAGRETTQESLLLSFIAPACANIVCCKFKIDSLDFC